ncbi:helix-turn-helix transcriptional regulator [Actinophytocola sp.]|uniref:helix-turn-helix transcriptional regulator n=1 Tax=Actinophytocola sp. TaxID=1872138 RepID=UPI0025C0D14F|nr:helix-turn-helix transcriptional regulator [Actinophytocola sp.]
MYDNLGEPISIDDMARTAMFSKFHFSRIFQRVTGISPGRFLSALRLQEAKRLLLTSSLTVADICHLVGYNSIGTFSSRFRYSVGVSPTEYRQYRGYVKPLANTKPPCEGHRSVVSGRVWQPPTGQPGHVVVGLFAGPIAQGVPIRHSTLAGAGGFTIEDVPDGTWSILAHSVEMGFDQPDPSHAYMAAYGPVTVASDQAVHGADLRLRSRCIFDPPVLLAQLDRPMWTTTQAWATGRVDHAALPAA